MTTDESPEKQRMEESVEAHFRRIDDALFGSWSDKENEATKRNLGLLERFSRVETSIKLSLGGIALLVLRSLGVPTDQVAKMIEHLVSWI